MIEDLIQTAEAILEADAERAEWARWLALCECSPTPRDIATPAGFNRWVDTVNRKAQEIFSRLQ